MLWHFIFYFATVKLFVSCKGHKELGSMYQPTKGEVWPEPQKQIKINAYYVLETHKAYTIKTPYHSCDILDHAVNRHLHYLLEKYEFTREKRIHNKIPEHDKTFKGTYSHKKTNFRIELAVECEMYPHFEMDESYKLTVGDNIVLSSSSIWGILRGLETLNHLLYFSNDYSEIRINATRIVDYPAYKYRGLLIDTGRHYLQVDTIKSIISAMEMNKMNVLHWHIVDDQSFSYQSKIFPTLSEKGAFHPSMIYTHEDIQQIVEHARLAGIRVIPEFDTPGHVRSWGAAFPEILTKCYNKTTKVTSLGSLNPLESKTYRFLQQLYQEIRQRFPDKYLHIGGDEVGYICWMVNPEIKKYMMKNNITTKRLLAKFINNVTTLIKPPAKYMVWQDVFEPGTPLLYKPIIQVWRYGWIQTAVMIINAGYQVVVSAPWYLDYFTDKWEDYHTKDPRKLLYNYRFQNDTGLENIVGGEVSMWGEMADGTNIMTRIWPRTSAVAERLWTGHNYTDPNVQNISNVSDYVRRRLEEHICRMIQRGYNAEPPNGPGFCLSP